MPSTFGLLAVSSLAVSIFSAFTSAAVIPQLEKRQGCSSIEPNDPNCLLPFWTDTPLNLTFDDLKMGIDSPTYWQLNFTNLTVDSPELSAPHYILPYSASNYLRLKASTPALITPEPSMAFFKILSFYFGCSHTSSGARKERPQNCTLTVSAMCAGPGESVIDVQEISYDYEYTVAEDAAMANMTYASMDTNGQRYECYNYTLSAEGPGGAPAVLFLDQMDIVEYFDSDF